MYLVTFRDKKVVQYNGYDIISTEIHLLDNETKKKLKAIDWSIYKDGMFRLRDVKTIDGKDFNNSSQAINDAKTNITTNIRLGYWS